MRPNQAREFLDESRFETRVRRCTISDDSAREEAVALCARTGKGQQTLVRCWAIQNRSVPDNAKNSSEAKIAAETAVTWGDF